MGDRIAPSVRYVRSLEGKYYLLREAAEILGVSHRTLRNLVNSGDESVGPAFYTYLGKIKIYLYTDDDLIRLRKHFDQQKIIYPISEPDPMKQKGRPAKWTPEQRKARQRKFSQVHYYKVMAERHANDQEPEKANKAIAKMRKIQQELREQDQNQTYKLPKGMKNWPQTDAPLESPTNSSSKETSPGLNLNTPQTSETAGPLTD